MPDAPDASPIDRDAVEQRLADAIQDGQLRELLAELTLNTGVTRLTDAARDRLADAAAAVAAIDAAVSVMRQKGDFSPYSTHNSSAFGLVAYFILFSVSFMSAPRPQPSTDRAPAPTTLASLVPRAAQLAPDAVALVGLDAEFSWHDVERRTAGRVQRELMQGALHARPGVSSAALNRSSDVLLNSVTSRFDRFAGHSVTTDWVHTGYGDRDHTLRVQIADFDGSGSFRLHVDVNVDVFGSAERGGLLAQVETVIDRFDPSTDTGPSVPIGRPAANTRICVVDQYDQAVPPGVPGDMLVGGDGVARGYLNEPELTATRFFEDATRPGLRWYRTGDLARWGVDGRLEFLGRTDQQVKIRGARIELGDIEVALRAHPAILRSTRPPISASSRTTCHGTL